MAVVILDTTLKSELLCSKFAPLRYTFAMCQSGTLPIMPLENMRDDTLPFPIYVKYRNSESTPIRVLPSACVIQNNIVSDYSKTSIGVCDNECLKSFELMEYNDHNNNTTKLKRNKLSYISQPTIDRKRHITLGILHENGRIDINISSCDYRIQFAYVCDMYDIEPPNMQLKIEKVLYVQTINQFYVIQTNKSHVMVINKINNRVRHFVACNVFKAIPTNDGFLILDTPEHGCFTTCDDNIYVYSFRGWKISDIIQRVVVEIPIPTVGMFVLFDTVVEDGVYGLIIAQDDFHEDEYHINRYKCDQLVYTPTIIC